MSQRKGAAVWPRSVLECTDTGCDLPQFCRQMCSKHYTRWRRHGQVDERNDRRPYRTRGVRAVTCADSACDRPPSSSSRWCIRCGQSWSKYHMTETDYVRMLEAQAGGCAVCRKTPDEEGKALAFDHSHACCSGKRSCGKCVRGLLCGSCNTALGKIERHGLDSFRNYIETYEETDNA